MSAWRWKTIYVLRAGNPIDVYDLDEKGKLECKFPRQPARDVNVMRDIILAARKKHKKIRVPLILLHQDKRVRTPQKKPEPFPSLIGELQVMPLPTA
jgi:hypothetical protein